MKPIVGINCDYEEEGRYPYSFLYRDYVQAVITAGGIPLLLPTITDISDIKLLLQKINGLILTGGNDVPPQRYGNTPHEKTHCVHPDKDASDTALIMAALQMHKPILAICYGMQLVNVVLGGSLVQDIPSEYPNPIIHKDPQNKRYTHTVTIEKNSHLYGILKTDRIETNSVHHQAVKDLGKGLQETAHTEDGIVEAFELQGHPFLVGVQWHPERMINAPQHLALFSALVGASR